MFVLLFNDYLWCLGLINCAFWRALLGLLGV